MDTSSSDEVPSRPSETYVAFARVLGENVILVPVLYC
jgi:hypothetical protein